MAKTVQKITLSASRDIPFNRLVLSQANVRRLKVGVSIEDLAEDIARRGLLQSRNVRPGFDVEGAETALAELVGKRQPDMLLLNDADHAYAKIRLDDRSLATAVADLSRLDDSLARALVWGAAWDMTRDGEMPATDFVRLVLANIGSETDAWGVTRIPASAALAVNAYSAPEHRAGLDAADDPSGDQPGYLHHEQEASVGQFEEKGATLVLLGGLVQIGVEEFAGEVLGALDGAVDRRAVGMHVEHVHEHADLDRLAIGVRVVAADDVDHPSVGW